MPVLGVLCALLAAISFSIAAAVSAPSAVGIACLTLTLCAVEWTMSRNAALAGTPVLPTFAILVPIVLAVGLYIHSGRSLWALVTGLLADVLLLIRTSNALVLPGPAIAGALAG